MKSRAKTLLADAPAAEGSPAHRGRIQVQGEDVRGAPSFSWTRATPVSKVEAKDELSKLKDACTPAQIKARDVAFVKAAGFIDSGPIKIELNPVSRTFQNRNLPRALRRARVDIEVILGVAFI